MIWIDEQKSNLKALEVTVRRKFFFNVLEIQIHSDIRLYRTEE